MGTNLVEVSNAYSDRISSISGVPDNETIILILIVGLALFSLLPALFDLIRSSSKEEI